MAEPNWRKCYAKHVTKVAETGAQSAEAALKVAEAILANLNRYRGLLNGDDIPRTTEIILSFDDPFEDFSRKLKQLSKEWEASGLREQRR